MSDEIRGDELVGLDGKRYPRRALVREYGWNIIGLVHAWRHDDGLSIRQIRARITAEGQLRPPSVGTIHAWLRQPCTDCSGDPNDEPEHGDQDRSGGGNPSPEQSEDEQTAALREALEDRDRQAVVADQQAGSANG